VNFTLYFDSAGFEERTSDYQAAKSKFAAPKFLIAPSSVAPTYDTMHSHTFGEISGYAVAVVVRRAATRVRLPESAERTA
jgi:hypothetical protein